jgi:putative sterol carrier protein
MSNKELETFGGLRARLVVGAILRLAPTALNRRRAARVRHTAIEWRVTIPGGDASVHTMVITEGRARVRRGIVAEPNMTLTIDTADFLRLVAGMENGAALFMGGRVKIEGDPTVALSLARLFRMPRA